jgi:hypothetical protein
MPRKKTEDWEHPYEKVYVPKGPATRATANQLWRLNMHDGYIERALAQSGGRFIQADVAHELIAFLKKEGFPNYGGDPS